MIEKHLDKETFKNETGDNNSLIQTETLICLFILFTYFLLQCRVYLK